MIFDANNFFRGLVKKHFFSLLQKLFFLQRIFVFLTARKYFLTPRKKVLV